VPFLLQRANEVAKMQHKLYNDTLALFDAAEISGESIDPGISAGVIDSLRFFSQSRVKQPVKTDEESDEAMLQVGAPALLMYHLTLVKERSMCGIELGRLSEFNSTLLHRALKDMFPRYLEHCCTDAETILPPAEPVAPGAGMVSVSWGEYPYSADYSSNFGNESRPSSAASIAVYAARESESEVRPKKIASTLIYSIGAVEADGPAGPIGMIECDVHKVQQLHRDLCGVRFDINEHTSQGGDALPEELLGAAHECILNVQRILQRKQDVNQDSPALPEDPTSWITTLEAIFERQSGFSASVDLELHRFLAEALRRD